VSTIHVCSYFIGDAFPFACRYSFSFRRFFSPVLDGGVQHREIVSLELEQAGYLWFSQYFNGAVVDEFGLPVYHNESSGSVDGEGGGGTNSSTIGDSAAPNRASQEVKVDAEGEIEAASTLSNLERVKERGFRTIIILLEDPEWDIPEIANAAEALGMLDGGEYFFVLLGPFRASLLFPSWSPGDGDGSNTNNVTKLLYGSAWIAVIEPWVVGQEQDRFFRSLTSQGASFVDLVNSMNPISPGQPGYVYADPYFFQNLTALEINSGFVYDAVIAIGIGACLAHQHSNSTTGSISSNSSVAGRNLLHGIRQADFVGASGEIRFRNEGNYPGAREWDTEWFGAFNLLPPGRQGEDGIRPWVFSDLYEPGSSNESVGWKEISPFTWPDGSTDRPPPLRNPPNFNFLSTGLKALGYALLGIAVGFSLGSMIWVYIHREHRIVRAAQPFFLYVVGMGCIIFCAGIVPLSFDESSGMSEQQLSAACMSTPWLVCFGVIIMYCGLFSKLWRVNKVLQFSRRKVEIRHVAWPAALLCLAALVVLSVWTAVDGIVWVRTVVDSWTGESMGMCSSDHFGAFAGTLVAIIIIPATLTAFFAWKTKDVDGEYSDSLFIFGLIGVHLEIIIIGVPVVSILQDVSTDGRYVGIVLILWSFPMSAITLIFVPKMIAYWKSLRAPERSQRKRGERSHGQISGMQSSGVFGLPSASMSGVHHSNYNNSSNFNASSPLTGSSNNLSAALFPESVVDETAAAKTALERDASTAAEGDFDQSASRAENNGALGAAQDPGTGAEEKSPE